MTDRPIIAVTMGDPAGIGPEVVLGALRSQEVYRRSIPIVIGSMDILRRLGAKPISLEGPEDATGEPGKVEVIDVQVPGIQSIEPGKVQAVGGLAADAFIRKACELALEKRTCPPKPLGDEAWAKSPRRRRIDAISTAPISKESLRAAGIQGIGHTELLAEYLNRDRLQTTDNRHQTAPEPLTLFVTENMRIFFLSRHLSLRQAIDYITQERLLDFILAVDRAMRKLGFPKPRIAVAALNPHASDGGQFGSQEAEIIMPAILQAQAKGIDVTGPIGADSVFHQALERRFDCVISLYHDQGHIAAKTRDFFRTVTATLNLPVLRTSVDHGTGFDIAWQGKANSISMESAILAACDLLPCPP